MPAPKGNKNAIGNQGGRVSEFDKTVEAQALLEWAKTDKALVLRMFAPLRGYSFDTMTRWAEENFEFRQAYIQAKDLVGARRELVLIEKGCPSPFQRYASYYDNHLQDFERQEKAYEASLKNPQEQQPTQVIFRVNYDNDSGDKVQVSSKELPNKNTKGSK